MNKGLRYKGPSRDGRTNAWNWTCPKCYYNKDLETTMYATGRAVCDKCEYEEFLDYNKWIEDNDK